MADRTIADLPSSVAQISHSVVIDPVKPALGPRSDTETTSHEGSPVPNVGLPIPSAPLRWSLFAKKSKQKLRKASSLFTSLNSFSDLHEKVSVRFFFCSSKKQLIVVS